MAERIEGHYPVAPTRELAGERSLHLLRKEQPRQQHGGTRALSPDGVGEALALIPERSHRRQHIWPASQQIRYRSPTFAAISIQKPESR